MQKYTSTNPHTQIINRSEQNQQIRQIPLSHLRPDHIDGVRAGGNIVNIHEMSLTRPSLHKHFHSARCACARERHVELSMGENWIGQVDACLE